ncbi:MAG: DnaJ domain-containing protein [Pseudomonadota bacterium]
MPYAIAVIAIFVMVVLLLPRLANANPATLARAGRGTIAGTVFAIAAFFALRGLLPVAIPLFLFGLFLLGAQRGFNRTSKSPGQKSSVRTSVLDMWLNHDDGSMDGTVLTGQHTGRQLSELGLAELLQLLGECVSAGDQSEALLMAYLDRVHPQWREQAGSAGGNSGAGSMSREDALDVLGLKEGASEKEIRSAYRRMMKKHHPDNGGSAYLAARINEANDVLTGGKPADQ